MGTGLAPSSVLQGAEDVWQFAVIAEAGICLALVKPEALIFPGDHAHAGTLGGQDAIGAVLDGHACLRRKRQHLRRCEIDLRWRLGFGEHLPAEAEAESGYSDEKVTEKRQRFVVKIHSMAEFFNNKILQADRLAEQDIQKENKITYSKEATGITGSNSADFILI